jgi:hypothetical protein
MLKFFWNGVKGSDKKLRKCSYSLGGLINYPADTITIYCRGRFSAEVAEQFTVQNESDSRIDYFEAGEIRVLSSHPLYEQVKAALLARDAHYSKRATA